MVKGRQSKQNIGISMLIFVNFNMNMHNVGTLNMQSVEMAVCNNVNDAKHGTIFNQNAICTHQHLHDRKLDGR